LTIAFLSTMTDYYGGEVCIVNLARGLGDRGHDVLCVTRPDAVLAERARAAGVEVVTLPLLDWYEPRGVLLLRRLLVARDVEILHTHLPRDHFIAAAASAGLDVRNIGTRHQLRPIAAVPFKRPFFRRFSTLIAVSEAVRRGLEAAPPLPAERLVTVPNGLPAPVAAERGALRRLAGIAPDAPVVGYVGRLCPTKGLDVLLDATARLRRGRPDARLVVVGGDGGDPGYARLLARRAAAPDLAGAVSFLGYVPEAGRLCGDFDVQAVPSWAEPFGLVSLEALAQGVPVVATASGGSPEIVRHGREGYLVPPGDREALARRLAALLAAPELRRGLGENGRRRVRRRFSLERMVEATAGVYAAALGSSLRRRRSA
jgi:glycosyltransferase involved in cell wall biosynthesis